MFPPPPPPSPPRLPPTPTAGLVLIGDELLSGKVVDENGAVLIKSLRSQGVAVRELRVIADDLEAIATSVRELAASYTWVFTTGGVGPTHDDITLEGVARAFGVPLVENEGMMQQIDELFASDPVKRESFRKMARVPVGSTLLRSAEIRWPIYQVENVFILPGVPQIFRKQFEAIRDRFRAEPFFLRTIYFRIGEGGLAALVTDACDRFPGVAFGSYPVWDEPDYRVRVTIESKERDQVDSAYRWLADQFDGDEIYKVVDGAT
jgi:molybdenum cofactor synthesis domain-containing protein